MNNTEIFLLQVEKLAEKEKNLKAKQGWFSSWIWGPLQNEEEGAGLNSAAAISMNIFHPYFILFISIVSYYYYYYLL